MKIRHLETLTTTNYFHHGKLPCVVRVMKATPSNETIAMHGHEFSELVLVASGSLKHFAKRKTTVLKAGDFLIIHPGARHGYAEPTADTVVYNLVFVEAVREYAHLLVSNPLTHWIFPGKNRERCTDVLGTIDAGVIERVVRLMDEMRTEERSPSATSPAYCGALFVATLSLLIRGLETPPSSPEDHELLRPETAYIDGHLQEKITVETLCKISGKSSSALNRLFRAAFHRSPIDYLIARRLDQAEILCSTTDDTLASIAIRCGFADASHLLRTFHRHGRTPPRRKKG